MMMHALKPTGNATFPPPQDPPISLVCMDMAGTTVEDSGVVLSAFERSLDALGITPDGGRDTMTSYVKQTMGASKITVFRDLFKDEAAAVRANDAFESAYVQLVEGGGAHPIPGAEQAIRTLRKNGVRVVLLTGFSPSTRDYLIDHLGWGDLCDAALCPADVGRGRPAPDLVLHAVLTTATDDVAAVAVVGDTTLDMESGRRAGASLRIGVRTGAHRDPLTLRTAGATHVVESVRDVPPLLSLAPTA